MALAQKTTQVQPLGKLTTPLRVAVCGEVSSGKSTVIHTLSREAFLPDFFGIEDRPVIRFVTGADADAISVIRADGRVENLEKLEDLVPESGLAEITISRRDPSHFGPVELIEMPPLRDGHVTEQQIERIADCDVMIWVTIGSQAWRLSEKTILDDIGARRPGCAMMVVSRGDKFRSAEDAGKLMERMHRETADYFSSCTLMSAAPKAIASSSDDAVWAQTGGHDLVSRLLSFAEENVEAAASRADNVLSFAAHSEQAVPEPEPEPEAVEIAAIDAAESRAAEPEASESAQPAVEQSAVAEAVIDEPTPEPAPTPTPADELQTYVSSLYGVIAIGSVDATKPKKLEIVSGERAAVRKFADFSLRCRKSLHDIAGFGGTDPNPEGAQVTMQNHQVLFRDLDGKVFFLACDSKKMSTGIARTAFARVARLHTEARFV
jgi:hypothetical protein